MKKVTLFVEYGYFICWILLSYPLEMVISFVGNGCSICWIRLFHPHFSIILPRKQPFRMLLRVLSERDWLLMKQIREHYAVYSPIMQWKRKFGVAVFAVAIDHRSLVDFHATDTLSYDNHTTKRVFRIRTAPHSSYSSLTLNILPTLLLFP